MRKFARFVQRTMFLNKKYYTKDNGNLRFSSTMVQQPPVTRNLVKVSLIGAAAGVAIGAGYAYYKINRARENIALEGTEKETVLLKYKPLVTPSRKVF